MLCILFSFFFFNDTATTEIYTLSLHDALPISSDGGHQLPRQPPHRDQQARRRRLREGPAVHHALPADFPGGRGPAAAREDRKSTRLNSSHGYISYAVFCLKKKKKKKNTHNYTH